MSKLYEKKQIWGQYRLHTALYKSNYDLTCNYYNNLQPHVLKHREAH